MSEISLSIGGLKFCLRLPALPRVDEEIYPFVVEAEGACDVAVDYQPVESVLDAEVTVSQLADNVIVRYHPRLSYRFAALRGCLIYLPMEQLLLVHNRFFLHASFATSEWGGLLFTGNSGVGKSTQAELWKEHMGSTIINGDRAIVAKESSGWYAYGSPYSGSSHYYVQRKEPVRTIILLEQASENRISPVSPGTAFRKLLLQISADHRETGEINHLCDLVTELIETVPIYLLSCTPDVRAVNTLRAVLEKGGI